jgi:hypothetical protein
MNVDTRILNDLVTFARIEKATHDIEPWAEVIAAVELPRSQKIWLATLYNTHDDLHSAWSSMRLWPSPHHWGAAENRHRAAEFNCTQERRNLRGGRVLQRHASYVSALAGRTEAEWMTQAIGRIGAQRHPGRNFARLTEQMRTVWGVGRQSAFEWAEFMGKVAGMPVDAADGQLWESSGPRRSLEDLFRMINPSPAQLDDAANITRDYLYGEGVDLPWVDFETVICDFLVMRRGRYYPGRHLAALREEIWTLPDPEDRELAKAAWYTVIPHPWNEIPLGGIDDTKMPIYRATGRIIDRPHS